MSVAACMKVQINDRDTELLGALSGYPRLPASVSMEQSCVAGLLFSYFSGWTQWADFFVAPMKVVNLGEPIELEYVGMVLDPMDLLGIEINSDGMYQDESGDWQSAELIMYAMPTEVGYIGFDDNTLKQALISIQNVGKPNNWRDLVENTPVEDLQALIDSEIDNETKLVIHKETTTLTIHRCTQQDIDSLFQGDHDPHTDMFDTARAMLASHLTHIDDKGFAPAYYDAAKDVIVFRSDYRLTMVDTFSGGEMMA